MQPREIDSLVAEKAMGFEWRRALVGCKVLVPPTGPDAEWGRDWTDALQGGERVCSDGLRMVPAYSADRGVSWQVVEKMLEGANAADFGHELLEMADAGKCTTYADMVCAVLDTMTPERICLAALRALGIPEGGE